MQHAENATIETPMIENLRELITEQLQSCQDEELLDLIWKLLIS